jgi:hypothetical protein
MYFNTYGCHGWGDYESTVEKSSVDGSMKTEECVNEAFTWGSPFYFVTYVMISAFFVLNLFVGIVVNSSITAATQAEARRKEAHEWAIGQRLKDHAQQTAGSTTETARAGMRKITSRLPGSARARGHDTNSDNPVAESVVDLENAPGERPMVQPDAS